METKIERNKDGTIKGVSTMGDFIRKEELTPEQKKAKEIRDRILKKHEGKDA